MEEFFDLGIEIKPNIEQQKVLCPKCSHTRKNKKERCLSVNLKEGTYHCHHCGWSGNVKFKAKKPYILPEERNAPLSPKMIEWFEKRGISEDTLINWQITQSNEYFPQVNENRNAINFNYYRDGKLINVKYRDAEKNFRLVKDAELIFYGIDNIKEVDHCYIVEGEMDALSLYEAGIYSVVSVPNGATKSGKLEYLDNCYKYFKDKKQITLFTDNDEAGISLRNELARRFGRYKCQYIENDDFKDANEILATKGAEHLRKVLKTAKKYPIEGVIDLEKNWNSILDFNEKGIQNYSIGFDDEFFKMAFGEWSIVTGIPNSGKSDFLDQVIINLALSNNFRTAFYSPESFPYEGHVKRIANKIKKKNCTRDDLNEVKDFVQEHFYFLKIDLENLTLKGILDKFRELVLSKGVNVLVIDPYNMLDHSAQKDYSYIGRILSEITQFVQQTGTHLFLVAHPRKLEVNNGRYSVPTPYDISGSSDFFNKAYNCITVFREIGEKSEYDSDPVRIYIQKVKRKENGKQGSFRVAPIFKSGGYYKQLENVDLDFLPF